VCLNECLTSTKLLRKLRMFAQVRAPVSVCGAQVAVPADP